MKKSDFESFQRGMAQAHAYLEGARDGFVVHRPVDVRSIRESLNQTRKEFAATFGLDVRTVEQWEQGRRKPDRSTITYLRLIERHADEMAKFVCDLVQVDAADDDHDHGGRQIERLPEVCV